MVIFKLGPGAAELRLDWSDIDGQGQPTLDADFKNRETGKHRKIKGKRKSAHHTTTLAGKGRCYKWKFDTYSRQFSVKIDWIATITENIQVSDCIKAEIISKKN